MPGITTTRNAPSGSAADGTSSSAGRNVSITTSAAAMPTAATGPVDLFELRSEKSSISSPSDAVPPDARIGSTVPRQAALSASTGRS